jgi:hypothetical protein
MSLWIKLFGKKSEPGKAISDLPTYWNWVISDNPIEQFTGIGSIELVFRNNPDAIGSEEHRKSTELLKRTLFARNKGIQAQAIQVLALIKASEALPEIIQKTYDSAPKVQEAAVLALGYFCDPRVKERLDELFNEKSPKVFEAVKMARERLSKQ